MNGLELAQFENRLCEDILSWRKHKDIIDKHCLEINWDKMLRKIVSKLIHSNLDSSQTSEFFLYYKDCFSWDGYTSFFNAMQGFDSKVVDEIARANKTDLGQLLYFKSLTKETVLDFIKINKDNYIFNLSVRFAFIRFRLGINFVKEYPSFFDRSFGLELKRLHSEDDVLLESAEYLIGKTNLEDQSYFELLERGFFDNINNINSNLLHSFYRLNDGEKIVAYISTRRFYYGNDGCWGKIKTMLSDYVWLEDESSPIDATLKDLLIEIVDSRRWRGFYLIKTLFYKGRKLFNNNSNMNISKKINKLLSLGLKHSYPIRIVKHNSPNNAGDYEYFKKPMKYSTVYID